MIMEMRIRTRMKRILWLGLALLCLLSATSVRAELVVIASRDSGIGRLSKAEVVNIFMGRYRKLPNEAVAAPLDIDGDAAERREFYLRLVGKSPAEINAYWAHLVFSGRTTAPEELASQQAVLERVARDPAAIGYVDRKNLNGKVKVIYEFTD